MNPPSETRATESEERGGCLVPGRVVVFHLDGQRYALPIENVREIQQIVAFSGVPGAEPGVLGMVNLRGEVIPALDARILLDLPVSVHGLETPMVIVSAGDRSAALVVDEVEDVLAVSAECLQPAPPIGSFARWVTGVARIGDELVYLLEPEALLAEMSVVA